MAHTLAGMVRHHMLPASWTWLHQSLIHCDADGWPGAAVSAAADISQTWTAHPYMPARGSAPEISETPSAVVVLTLP